jgi:hypothetical protein
VVYASRANFRSLDLDFAERAQNSSKLSGAELTSIPASVASIFLVGRVQLTISLALAITAHGLINPPRACVVENKKSRYRALQIDASRRR